MEEEHNKFMWSTFNKTPSWSFHNLQQKNLSMEEYTIDQNLMCSDAVE